MVGRTYDTDATSHLWDIASMAEPARSEAVTARTPADCFVQHPPIRQREVRREMMRPDHVAHRQIRHRRVDVRHEMESAGADP
jgi:hypothetical protein